jgi:ABC-type multidrug transport system fused ATPase/permease subunit
MWPVVNRALNHLSDGVDNSLTWVSVSQLEIPIRSQLSAIIFESSTRKRIIKVRGEMSHRRADDGSSLASLPSEEEPEDSIQLENLETQSQSVPLIDKPKDKEKNPDAMTNQGTINLLAVDATRVAEFAARQYVLLGILISMSIAIVVLVRLIGWTSLGVGVLAPVVITPVAMLASRAYSVAQKRLMKERDRKLTTITEALKGIRQIKFSATEVEWEKNIMEVRDSELKQQRNVFVWIIVLRFLFISSPILLSLASLATYAWINGSLSPSVAFTALAVFDNLEFCLSLTPFALTQAVDASISCRRIEQHIWTSNENPMRNVTSGDSVEFRDATIAWPTDAKSWTGDRFVLRNVNAKFPSGKLR